MLLFAGASVAGELFAPHAALAHADVDAVARKWQRLAFLTVVMNAYIAHAYLESQGRI